jgi:hypothetical protein
LVLKPSLCASGEQVFYKIVKTASGHSIPAGFDKDYTPGLPREAVLLTTCCDMLCCIDPLDP